MKILFIGDIVGRPGRTAVKEVLPKLKKEHKIDLVFANADNLAGGIGITLETYQEMVEQGIDYLTSGNHIWDKKEIIRHLDDKDIKIIRPSNYPKGNPGRGFVDLRTKGQNVRLVHLQGRVFMPEGTDSPFQAAEEILKETFKNSVVILDFHAEATSEKQAMGHFLAGRVAAVLGTHTHVQTADFKILPGGTAYITDIGMTGPEDSVIGDDKEIILKRFLTGILDKIEVAKGIAIFQAVILEIDEKTKRAKKILPVIIRS